MLILHGHAAKQLPRHQAMTEHVTRLKEAIESTHMCAASFADYVPVTEMLGRKVAWEGVVTVFDISCHPQANRCYAWEHTEKNERQLVTVLHIPPIDSPRTAVQRALLEKIGAL